MAKEYLDKTGLTHFWDNIKGEIGNASDAQVDDWLDRHPEATTTVQDGSITTAKLANGAVTDAKLAQSGGILQRFSDLEKEIYSGDVDGIWVIGGITFNVTPWINNTNNNFISTNVNNLLHLMEGDTITVDSDCSIYLIGYGFNYASTWTPETITIPKNGTYGVMIKRTVTAAFSSVTDITINVTTSGLVRDIYNVGTIDKLTHVALDLSNDGNRRLASIDGEYTISPTMFELGNIVIDINPVQYRVSTSRVRVMEGYKVRLSAGDVVKLTTGVFYIGWWDDEGTKHYHGGWVSSFTISQDGDYIWVMRYSEESEITDFNAFISGLQIIPYNKDSYSNVINNNIGLGINPLRFDRYYDHMLLDKINGNDVIIPLQSIPSIFMSKRLGFKVIEANVKKTSDDEYVVMHGTNGKFGTMFEHVDGVTDISNIAINSVTLSWIKENVRFKSTYAKYRTAPASLEEYLEVCKKLKMIPLIQVANDAGIVDISNHIMGKDNYIAYNSDRTLNSGVIMIVRDHQTKEAILNECDSLGNPLMYFMANPSYFTDEQLSDIIQSLHDRGYVIGFQDTYVGKALADKYMRMGFDYCATTYCINDIECGNMFNLNGDVSYSDFDTNGTVDASGNLVLQDGQYIRKLGEQRFLIGMVIYIRFSGTLTVNVAANFIRDTYISDGSEYVRISGGFLGRAASFTFTSTGETTIYELSEKASSL